MAEKSQTNKGAVRHYGKFPTKAELMDGLAGGEVAARAVIEGDDQVE